MKITVRLETSRLCDASFNTIGSLLISTSVLNVCLIEANIILILIQFIQGSANCYLVMLFEMSDHLLWFLTCNIESSGEGYKCVISV